MSFNTLEHPAFKAYSNELEDRHIDQGRKAIINKIDKVYGNVKNVLLNDLSQAPLVSLPMMRGHQLMSRAMTQ